MPPTDAPPPIAIERVSGFPADLDRLAAAAPDECGFLRAAWFAAAAGEGETLVARRGCGTPIMAIPTTPAGPAVIGMRAVPGSYWPFRSVLISPCATGAELTRALSHRIARDALPPIWRLGPVYADDPAIPRIKRATGRVGWTVLARSVGRTWLFDLAATDSWPRRSTRRRLTGYQKQLAGTGTVRVDHVSGAAWNARALAAMAGIEAGSWVGKTTDGSGAKFLTEDRRLAWTRTLADPDLAAALSATILSVDGVPAAFSFDLRAGSTQYAIASSYDERFAAFRPGRIVTWRQLERARAEGVTRVDLGAGDSGYKREMGARAGPEVMDLLVVRSRPAASLLRFAWGQESPIARAAYDDRERPAGSLTPLIAAGVLATAALALAE